MSEEIKLIQHPSVKVIRRSEDYVVDGIGKVTVLTAIDQQKALEAKEPLTLYQGFAILGVPIAGTVRQLPVEWLMENVLSIENAFEVFQSQAVAELKKNMEEAQHRAEAERNRIITAPAGAVPNIKLVK